jgi:hypothetical protein
MRKSAARCDLQLHDAPSSIREFVEKHEDYARRLV